MKSQFFKKARACDALLACALALVLVSSPAFAQVAPAAQAEPPRNLDKPVLIDGGKLSTEAKAAISGITELFAKSTLPDRAKRLHALAHADKDPSIADVANEVDGMRQEFDRLAKDLPAKVTALEKAEDGFANGVAALQAHLAKRGADGTTGKNAPAVAGYRDHLRGLYDRAQRATTTAEKDCLARLLASSLQLWQAMQRAHGQLSDSERTALTRVIELLVRRQTDLAVASTRTKAFLVSLDHGRSVMEHVGGVFAVLAESEKVLCDLQGLRRELCLVPSGASGCRRSGWAKFVGHWITPTSWWCGRR